MLELDELSVRYGPVLAVDRVSLTVNTGQVVALLGANGAGKSSTLQAISGMTPASSGEIRWHGEATTGMPAHKIVRAGVSQVPEGREIFSGLNVLEHLQLGAYLRRDKKAIKADLIRVFDYFPAIADRHTQAVGTLSGGEQQMVVIGRALMARPSLLLLDEPSLGLAPIIVSELYSVLRKICDDMSLSVLLVEQEVNAALTFASFAYVLESGRLVAQDNSDALLGNETLRRSYLGY